MLQINAYFDTDVMLFSLIPPGDCLSHQHLSSVVDSDDLMNRPSGRSAAPASPVVSGTRPGVPSTLALPGESQGSSPPPPGTAPPPPYSPGSRPPPPPRLQHQLYTRCNYTTCIKLNTNHIHRRD